jgi:adenosine kinase
VPGAELQGLVDIVIVTRGAKGSYIIVAGQTIDIPAVRPQEEVDPTGVGDAYRAGIIAGYLRGYTWETTGRMGSLAATYVLEHSGTQNHKYTLHEFAERYGQHFGEGTVAEDLRRRGQHANKVALPSVSAV